MRNVILKNITDKADALAVEYNKTKDPGLRDQWYELIKKVSQVQLVDFHLQQERKKT